jgi:hypothetical protein
MRPTIGLPLFTFARALFVIGTKGAATFKGRNQRLGSSSFFQVILGDLNVLVAMDKLHEFFVAVFPLVIGNLDLMGLQPSRDVVAKLSGTLR